MLGDNIGWILNPPLSAFPRWSVGTRKSLQVCMPDVGAKHFRENDEIFEYDGENASPLPDVFSYFCKRLLLQ